jgi:nucleotidyltransferase substrate binding protein (TIGR01987 family)
MQEDIRWKQRFNNYLNAFQTLVEAVELAKTRPLSNLENQGLIQSFEFTHELAWNVLKDYLENKGIQGLIGSKDATRAAFKNGLITTSHGEVWMNMIKARNLTSHSYSIIIANSVTEDILNCFYPAFLEMAKIFNTLYQQIDNEPL